jgi:hypothetical protein
MDVDGKFYLIHPRENLSRRDLLTGQVVETYRTDTKTWVNANIMNILDLKIMLDYLLFSQRIVDLNIFDEINYLSENTDKLGFIFTEFIKMKINKTEISYDIDTINKDISSNEITYDIILTLLYSIKYGVYDNVLIIIVFLLACNFDMSNIYGIRVNEFNIPIKKENEFKSLYSTINDHSISSDYIVFLKIFSEFEKSYPDLEIFKERITAEQILKEYENNREEFIKIKQQQTNKNIIPEKYNINTYNKYNSFLNNNILNNEKGKQTIISQSKKSNKCYDKFMEQLKEYKENIMKWCENNYVNYLILNKFLVNYYYYETIFSSVYEKLNNLANKMPLDKIEDDFETNIIKAFFQAQGRYIKLAYYIPSLSTNISYFYMLNQSDIHMMAKPKSLARKKYLQESVLQSFSPIIMYHSASLSTQIKQDIDDEETDERADKMIDLGFISNIDKNWLVTLLPHIFNKKVTRESNTKYEEVNKIGKEILSYLNINNISYLIDINDKILKQYYKEFINKISEYTGGYKKGSRKISNIIKYYGGTTLKSFKYQKIKHNKILKEYINNYNYNIEKLLNRIYIKIDNNFVEEMYGKDYNGFIHKFI